MSLDLRPSQKEGESSDGPVFSGVSSLPSSNLEFSGQRVSRAMEEDSRCRKMLSKIKNILGPILKHCCAPRALHVMAETSQSATDSLLGSSLGLLKVLLDGEYCPHAKAVFDYGDMQSMRAPLLRIFALLVEPEVVKSELSGMLLDSFDSVVELIARNSVHHLLQVFEDFVELNSGVGERELSDAEASASGFFKRTLTISSASQSDQEEFRVVVRRALAQHLHTKKMTDSIVARILKQYLVVLGSQRAFQVYINNLSDRLDLMQASNFVSEASMVESYCAILNTAGEILQGGAKLFNGCCGSSLKITRMQLLEVASHWAETKISDHRMWKALVNALSASDLQAWDREDVDLLIQAMQAALRHSYDSAVGSRFTNVCRSFVKLCLEVYESHLEADPELGRHLSLLMNRHLFLDARIHARISHCMHLCLENVELHVNSLEEFLEDVTTHMKEDYCSAGVAEARLRKSKVDCLNSSLNMVTNSSTVRQVLKKRKTNSLSAVTAMAVTESISWCLGLIPDEDPAVGSRLAERRLRIASIAILLPALLKFVPSLSFANPTLQLLLKKFSRFLANPPQAGDFDWRLEVATNLGLDLCSTLHRLRELHFGQIGEDGRTFAIACLKVHSTLCLIDRCKQENAEKADSLFELRLGLDSPQVMTCSKDHRCVEIFHGAAASRKAQLVSIEERLLVLAGSFPLDWFYRVFLPKKMLDEIGGPYLERFQRTCITIFSLRLLGDFSQSTRKRTMLQLPNLIEMLGDMNDNLVRYCGRLMNRLESGPESTQGSAFSLGSQHDDQLHEGSLKQVEIFAAFLLKLGAWASKETAPEMVLCGLHAGSRLAAIRLQNDAEKQDFPCTCHKKGTGSIVGSVRGSLLLFKQWLQEIFAVIWPIFYSHREGSKIRAIIISTCIQIFREVAHRGASAGESTELMFYNFGDMLSTILSCLNHGDARLRNLVAAEISLFVEGCGAGIQFMEERFRVKTVRDEEAKGLRRKFVSIEEATGRADVLRAMQSKAMQTECVGHLMKSLRKLVQQHQLLQRAAIAQNKGRFVSNQLRFESVLHTFVVAIGSIGCSADISYVVDGMELGPNLLSWSLLMLMQQYAIATMHLNDAASKLGIGVPGLHVTEDEDGAFPSSLDFSGDEAAQKRKVLLNQFEWEDGLRHLVVAQLERIAKAQGFFEQSVENPSGQEAAGFAVRALFHSMRKTLYPKLFCMLLTEPLVRRAPDVLRELVVEIFRSSASSIPASLGGASQSYVQSNESTMNSDGNVEADEGAKLLSKFVISALPDVLPAVVVRKLNEDVLLEIAKRRYTSHGDAILVKKLIIDHYEAWSVEMIEMLGNSEFSNVQMPNLQPSQGEDFVEEQEQDEDQEQVRSRGLDAWNQFLQLFNFSVKQIFKLSEKHVLAKTVLRVVDEKNRPNESALNSLRILADPSWMDKQEKKRNVGDRRKSARILLDDDNEEVSDVEPVASAKPDVENHLKAFIREHFMYLMGVLSESIEERWKTTKDRMQGLRCCLFLLKQLREEDLELFLPKIFPTLQTALQDSQNEEVQEKACEVMFFLVRNLSEKAVHENLSSIVASLLPCLRPLEALEGEESNHSRPEDLTVRIISYLVRKKVQDSKEDFSVIYELLPQRNPKLANIYKLLHEKVGQASILQRLRQLSVLIQHASTNVRLLALEELQDVLKKNVMYLHMVILDRNAHNATSESDDTLKVVEDKNGGGETKGEIVNAISDLIGILLRLNRECVQGRLELLSGTSGNSRHSSSVRLACSNCLGELGAIDPARLNTEAFQAALVRDTATGSFDGGEIFLDMNNEALGMHLLKYYLIKSLRAAPDPTSHMNVGMAIQEVLNFFKKRKFSISSLPWTESPSSRKNRIRKSKAAILRNDATERTQDIVKPFWDTNYDMDAWNPAKPLGRGGVFFFSPTLPLELAVRGWYGHLLKFCDGEQAELFKALRSLCLNCNVVVVDVLLFLLPYLIQNALETANIDWNLPEEQLPDVFHHIRNEIMGVLRDTWPGEVCPGDDDDTSSGLGDTQGTTIAGGHGQDLASGIKRNAHAIFTIVDTLSSWTKQIKIMHALKRTRKKDRVMYDGEFSNKENVERLLKRIPARCLAEAAYRGGAYARALRYMEDHIRSVHSRYPNGGGVAPETWMRNTSVQFERDEITFLHQIYAALEQEPDGLPGVIGLRARHDGGPGTGFYLGKSHRTVSRQEAESNSDKKYSKKRKRSSNTSPPPGGARPGDGGQPTLAERIYELEFNGEWDEAVSCYERLIEDMKKATKETRKRKLEQETGRDQGSNEEHDGVKGEKKTERASLLRLYQGQLTNLRKLNHLNLLMSLGKPASDSCSELQVVARSFSKEALWRLGRWKELEDSLNKWSTVRDADDRVSQMLMLNLGPGDMGEEYNHELAFAMLEMHRNSEVKDNDEEEALKQKFAAHLDRARLHIMALLSAVSMESYTCAYPLLLRLQGLAELQVGWEVVSMARRHRSRQVIGVGVGDALSSLPAASVAQLNASRQQMKNMLQRDFGWDERFRVTLPSVDMREELFEMRRVIFRLARLEVDEMRGWLSLAKTARIAEQGDSCLTALHRAQECSDSIVRSIPNQGPTMVAQLSVSMKDKEAAEVAQLEVKIEMAELLFQRARAAASAASTRATGCDSGDHAGLHRALMILEPVENEDERSLVGMLKGEGHVAWTRAKAFLLATNLMVESGQGQGEKILRRYKAISEHQKEWGKAHFHFSRFFEQLLSRLEKQENDNELFQKSMMACDEKRSVSAMQEFLVETKDGKIPLHLALRESHTVANSIIKHFGKSLLYGGIDHIYESLPRMLTLWYTKMEEMAPLLKQLDFILEGGSNSLSTGTSGRASSRHSQATAAVLREDGAKSRTSKSRRGSDNLPRSIKGAYQRINNSMKSLAKQLPAYVWYTAIPQLVSRLGVEHTEVFEITKDILCSILESYPAQACWHLTGVAESKLETRRDRGGAVFKAYMQSLEPTKYKWADLMGAKDNEFQYTRTAQIQIATNMFRTLATIAVTRDSAGRRTREGKLTDIVKLDLEKLQKNWLGGNMAIPTQKGLSIPVPSVSQSHDGPKTRPAHETMSSFASMPGDNDDIDEDGLTTCGVPMVVGLENRVLVLGSKAAPKRIKIRASDGVVRNFLCKTEERGDLRKDSRMMEFGTVVNRLFMRDPQSRRRKLRMKTYAVICLNESSGIMEWMENTTTVRQALGQVYAEEGIFPNFDEKVVESRKELEEWQNLFQRGRSSKNGSPSMTTERLLELWDTKLRSKFPPILHRWFVNRFAGPESWLEARTKFIRSTAVWSMVGYIVGLGDRHSENLLLNTLTGECVHVDFDCLFDKGLTLPRPELVPFRLTCNIVDAMDLNGAQGSFKKASEVCLHVLRSQKQVLLSVLESFVIDPLVEWHRVKQTQGDRAHASSNQRRKHRRELEKRKDAQAKLDSISERLDGIVRQRRPMRANSEEPRSIKTTLQPLELLPLSTQGQVHRLIQEASDPNNLVQLYSGWAPYV